MGVCVRSTDLSAAVDNIARDKFVGLRSYDLTCCPSPHCFAHMLLLRPKREYIRIGRKKVMLDQDLPVLNVSRRGSWFPDSFVVC